MTRRIRLKALVAIVFVVAIGSAEWRTQAQSQPVSSTLQAATADAAKLGIKTFRVQRPKTDNGITTLTIDLLGVNPEKLGVVSSEKDSATGTDRQSIEMGGRSLVVVYSRPEGGKGRVTVVGNGREIYSGAIEQQSQQFSDAFVAEFGELATIMGDAIKTAREVIRRGQGLAFLIQRQASSAPMLLRPIARTVYRWLPRPAVLFAATAVEDGPSCPQENGGENMHCEFAYGNTRSEGCGDAHGESASDCTNSYCLGCCAYRADGDGCDCGCLVTNFICECEACGFACRPPLEAPLRPIGPAEPKSRPF